MRAQILGSARARWHDLQAVFALRAFAIYHSTHFISTIGFWMQRIAVGWVTWQMTQSATWLGIVAFAELFPSLITGPLGGVLADRGARVRMMLVGQVVAGVVSGALAVCHGLGVLQPWLIVVFMAVIGGMFGLLMPARLAMASHLAPPPLLPAALAVNSTAFNLSRFVGPALAAGLLVASSATVVFAVAALCWFVFAAGLYRIRNAPSQSGPAPAAAPVGLGRVLLDLGHAPLILAAIAIQGLQGLLLRPATELFPAFAERVFDRGEIGLGLLNAALGAGAIVGALVFSAQRDARSTMAYVVAGTVIFAATLLMFSLSPWFWLALAVLVVQGVVMTSSNIAAMAHVQLHTPRDRLGRVLSIYSLVFRVGPALGAFLFGVGADLSSLRIAGALFALLALAGVAAIWTGLIRGRADRIEG